MAATTNELLQPLDEFLGGLTPPLISLKALIVARSNSFFSGITTVVVEGIDATYNIKSLPNDDNLSKYYVNNASGTFPDVIFDGTTAKVTLGAGRLVYRP